jgi:hypothetical protein
MSRSWYVPQGLEKYVVYDEVEEINYEFLDF